MIAFYAYMKAAGEPPAGGFRSTRPDQAFMLHLGGIAARLELERAPWLPAQAPHIGPETPEIRSRHAKGSEVPPRKGGRPIVAEKSAVA